MPYPLAVSRALAGYLYENRNEEWQQFMPCTFFKNCRRNANARDELCPWTFQPPAMANLLEQAVGREGPSKFTFREGLPGGIDCLGFLVPERNWPWALCPFGFGLTSRQQGDVDFFSPDRRSRSNFFGCVHNSIAALEYSPTNSCSVEKSTDTPRWLEFSPKKCMTSCACRSHSLKLAVNSSRNTSPRDRSICMAATASGSYFVLHLNSFATIFVS